MTKEQEKTFLEYFDTLSIEEKVDLYNYLLFRYFCKKFASFFMELKKSNILHDGRRQPGEAPGNARSCRL